jgi:centromere protein I
VVQDFLREYLAVWDGESNLDALLRLMEFLPVQPFEGACCSFPLLSLHLLTSLGFHQNYLGPLEAAVSSQDGNAFEKLIIFCKNTLRRWRVEIAIQEQKRHGSSESLREAFKALAEYADFLILTAICGTSIPSTLTSTVISFYETVAFATHDSTSPAIKPFPVIYPPVHIAYHLLFSSSLSDVSRLCSVLAHCKKAFENPKADITSQYTPTYTGKFNGQLMDICNLLWRNRALNSSDSNAAGCLCPESTAAAFQAYLVQVDREYSLPSAFGVSHNWLLSALSIALFRALEDEAEAAGSALSEKQAGPVTQRSLALLDKEGGLAISWKQYRVDVLRWLDERGLGGVKALMYSTMVNLKDNPG